MQRRTSARALTFLGVATASFLALAGSALAVNPATTTTDTGQTLGIEITSPADGATVSPGALTVTGTASVGSLGVDNAYYMVDVSGSTGFTAGLDCDGSGTVDAGDDLNGDGTSGDILDCEIAGVIAINDSLGSAPLDVAYGVFAASAATADIDPGTTDAAFTTPADADLNTNGTADLTEVALSTDQNMVQEFTSRSVGNTTDYNLALQAIDAAFSTQPAGEDNVAFFLSDGVPTASVQQSVLDGMDAVVHTFAVGTGAGGCDQGTSELRRISDETGGICTVVDDPSQLSDAVTTPVGIDRVEVTLNGAELTEPTLDALGNWSVDFTNVVAGPNLIEATVFASDASGTSTTADITVIGESPTTGTCTDLVAAQDIVVGEVCIEDDGTGNRTVTYTTDGGWEIVETHLEVAEQEDDVPQARSGNPVPGRFEFSGTHAVGTTSVTYDIGTMSGDIFAAHAVVQQPGLDSETAWGDGDRFVERGNWATYIDLAELQS